MFSLINSVSSQHSARIIFINPLYLISIFVNKTYFVVYFRSVKFQSTQKRKLVVEEEIIDEEQPKGTNIKSNEQQIDTLEPVTPSSSNNSIWNTKGNKQVPKKSSLLGIVKTNAKKVCKSSVEIAASDVKEVTTSNSKANCAEAKAAPSGLCLLGTYSDSDSSNE